VVKIEWYEGGRSEELPRRLILDGEPLEVSEILERALVYDELSEGYQRLLRVRCGGRVFRLTHEFERWRCREE